MELKYKADRPHGILVNDANYDNQSVNSSSSSTSDHGGSTLTQSVKDDENSSDALRKQLTEQESRNVLRLRVLVILVLVIIAAIICSLVYRLTAQAQLDEFENQYDGAAEKIIESFADIMDQMGAVTGLATAFTSHGVEHRDDTTWPFETLNNFQQKATHARQLSKALLVSVSHVVKENEFYAWDEYVNQTANQQWIEESLLFQKKLGLIDFESEANIEVHSVTSRVVDKMHHFHEQGHAEPDSSGENLYLPRWQTDPFMHDGLVNENILRDEYSSDMALHVIETGSAILGGFLSAPPGTSKSTDHDTSLFATLRSVQEGKSTPYLGDPLAFLFVPIFDDFREEGKKVVAVLSALIHWQGYFNRMLPENVNGIDLVLEYTCGDHFIHDHANSTEVEDIHEDHNHRQRERDLVSFTLIHEGGGPSNQTLLESEVHDQSTGAVHDEDEAHNADNSYWDLDSQSPNEDTGSLEGHGDHDEQDSNTAEQSEHSDHDDHDNQDSNTEEESDHSDHDDHEDESSQDEHEHDSHTEGEEEGEDHGAHFTYRLDGDDARVIGLGDLHDRNFNKWIRDAAVTLVNFNDGTVNGITVDSRCAYRVHVYPTQEFYDKYNNAQPMIITVIIAVVFLFAILMFMVYDRLVEHRQQIVLRNAAQSNAIVSSLFPKNVRDRLMEEKGKNNKYMGTKSRLKGMMATAAAQEDGAAVDEDGIVVESAIADLFPQCTVFFSDIAGFTAWSSSREPTQVFTLLQTVYQAFDELAKRRRVFKVETIGDSYVAVTGLPEPQERHAVIMVRFAFDCMEKFHIIARKLERVLGPDTTELSMRFGLHSGPVTAGVLRGERARFQLFGDTVNTASRMESTGLRGKIQVTENTAQYLRDAGKAGWLQEREDMVKAKGKGVLKTYWVHPKNKSGGGTSASSSSMDNSKSVLTTESDDSVDPAKHPDCHLLKAKLRLVDWVVQLLLEDIKRLLYARGKKGKEQATSAPYYVAPEGATCMDEVRDVIKMPEFDIKNVDRKDRFRDVVIAKDIVEDLREFVKAIAMKYRGNPFHNFDHACHVTMSVKKLIRRIVAPDLSGQAEEAADNGSSAFGSSTFNMMAMKIYDYSHGLSSDPLAMFAMTFSALIHDVDHRGISNVQLGVENPKMKEKYHNKSLAEQHSCDLAWGILMEDRFANLRQCLFGTQEELMRFRQLIVNVVLATDIFDAELGALRKKRWQQAFEAGDLKATESTAHDLRATIVIEHIIQASDVSHTMQHWHVYQKWNRCLFREMYFAYKKGRLAKDPATFWYKGELGFFDNYIIPLAGKLKECGVFGVSSDEYLAYAKNNRAEWEDCGAEVVAKLVAEVTEEWNSMNAGTAGAESTGAAIKQDPLTQK